MEMSGQFHVPLVMGRGWSVFNFRHYSRCHLQGTSIVTPTAELHRFFRRSNVWLSDVRLRTLVSHFSLHYSCCLLQCTSIVTPTPKLHRFFRRSKNVRPSDVTG